jgi:hypothetical protein
MRTGLVIFTIPLVILIAVFYFAITYALRRHQLMRLRALAEGEYVFTFNSSGWYQAALLDLQKHEIIDSRALTDDSNPVRRGPRWAAVSSDGIRIMHGYDPEPTVHLPWTRIGAIKEVSRTHGKGYGQYSTTAEGVSIGVHLDDGDISLLLDTPNPFANPWANWRRPSTVTDELNRLRTAPPTAKMI